MLLTAGAASLPAILFRASTMYASPLAHIPPPRSGDGSRPAVTVAVGRGLSRCK